MNTIDGWLKIKGCHQALQKVLNAIDTSGLVVSNLRLAKSLDSLSYHVNIEVQGDRGLLEFSKEISAVPEVDKFEFKDREPAPPARVAERGCW